MSRLFYIVPVLFLVACAHPKFFYDEAKREVSGFALSDNYEVTRKNSFSLPDNSSIYISQSVAMDTAADAEKQLSQIIYSTFVVHAPFVKKARESESYKEALNNARASNADYLIYPRLLVWEDNYNSSKDVEDRGGYMTASEMDDKKANNVGRDYAGFRFLLVEVNSGKILDTFLIEARSGLLTYKNDTPGQLVEKPLAQVALMLFP